MFNSLKAKITKRFAEMTTTEGELFVVDYDRDTIWQTYLGAFDDSARQSNNCNACRSFIREIGAVVTIDPVSLALRSIWDITDVPEEYAASVLALRNYVTSRPLAGLYVGESHQVGIDKNTKVYADVNRTVVWEHFHVTLPRRLQGSARQIKSNELRDSASVLLRSLQEINDEAVQIVQELISQNSLYRGPEFASAVQKFKELRAQYVNITRRDHASVRAAAWAWLAASDLPIGVSRIRGTVIGTLLTDLSEGKDLDDAVRSYEGKVAPTNYRRTTAVVTPRMLATAKKKLEELGLMAALDRRRLDTRDLTPANSLFVYRPAGEAAKDVFGKLADSAPPTTDKNVLSKVQEVSIHDFLTDVLPGAKSVRVLFEREHLGNLVTLTGPQDPDAPSLMVYNNSFGWDYSGGVADSIKERVKAAGGRVDGWMRISLAWFNSDDLDLHLQGPSGRSVFFGHKYEAVWGARLDVDANGGMVTNDTAPVENIYVGSTLPAGKYTVRVHNYKMRSTGNKGFNLEIECDGQVRTYGSRTTPAHSKYADSDVVFNVLSNGTLAFEDSKLSSSVLGVSKWGLQTGSWYRVNALTLSPNHWDRPQGNKHWFFLLDGCRSDERTRPFHNESLRGELAADRKACELLGAHIETAPAEGVELSGLGFSETIRNHLFVEVTGAFKRLLKVVF